MSLMDRIREAISAEHNAIERTPFSMALVDGHIAKYDYLFGLAQMHLIHSVLEQQCDSHVQVAPFFETDMRRAVTIERDFDRWGVAVTDFAVLSEARSIEMQLTRWSKLEPMSLLGFVYILEGSRIGSILLAKSIAIALGVSPTEGQGIDYHVEGARETPMRLRRWKSRVNEAEFSSNIEASIETSACEFMTMLRILYAALLVGESARCDASMTLLDRSVL